MPTWKPTNSGGLGGTLFSNPFSSIFTPSDIDTSIFTPLDRSSWTASASSQFDTSHTPAKAIDDDRSTCWHSLDTTKPQYLIIDLGSAQTFDTISIWPRQDSSNGHPTTIEVYVSDDGISWGSAIDTFTGITSSAEVTRYSTPYFLLLSSSHTKRYMKLNVTASIDNGSLDGSTTAYVAMAEVYIGTIAANSVFVTGYRGVFHAGFFGPQMRRSNIQTFNPVIQLLTGWPSTGGGSTVIPDWGTIVLPDGRSGQYYFTQFDMPNADLPVTYSVTSGSLPPGITLTQVNDHVGTLSGTPTTAGDYTFTLTATNSFGADSREFTITIRPPSNWGWVA